MTCNMAVVLLASALAYRLDFFELQALIPKPLAAATTLAAPPQKNAMLCS